MYAKLFEEFYCEFLKDVDIQNLNKTINMLKKIGQDVSKSC
jgi:hypothetical protein